MILSLIMMVENEEERSFLAQLYEDYHQNVYETCYKILKNHLVDIFPYNTLHITF